MSQSSVASQASSASIRQYDFKEKPPDDYFCPVSAELLLSANQTSCCGHHISEEVAERLEKEGKPCPFCNKPLKSTKDIFYRRLVSQVVVYCPKKAKGCKWEGEASGLEGHLGYASVEAGNCKYVEVPCPYICRRLYARFKIRHHMKEECPKRPFTCNYCSYEGSHSSVVNEHLPICDKFPTRCPNNCDEMLCRGDVKKHLDTECTLQVVKCDFEFAGCTAHNLHRRDVKRHMDSNTQVHLDLLAVYSRGKDKEIEALKSQVLVLTNIVAGYHNQPLEAVASAACRDLGFVRPPKMTLTNFQELHVKKEYWKSPAFYSHIGGYKMCLVVFPGSEMDQHGNEFMGVYLQMLPGEFDDHLKWPFRGKVEVRMLNQNSDTDHVDRVLLDASSYSKENFQMKMVDRVVSDVTPSVWGCGNFMPLRKLRFNKSVHTQYLKSDCIDFQVLSVSLLDSIPSP